MLRRHAVLFMSHWRRRNPKDDRGMVLIWCALAIPIMLLIAVLTVDLGLMHVARSNLQASLDAAALAAVREGTVAKAIVTHQADDMGPGGQIDKERFINEAQYQMYKADGFRDLVKFSGASNKSPYSPPHAGGYAQGAWTFSLIDGGYVTQVTERWRHREGWNDPVECEPQPDGSCTGGKSGSWDHEDHWHQDTHGYVVNVITKDKATRVILPSIDSQKAADEAKKVMKLNGDSWVEAQSGVFRNLKIEQAELMCEDPATGTTVTGTATCPNAQNASDLRVKYRVIKGSIEVKTMIAGALLGQGEWVKVELRNNEATSLFKKGS